MQLSSLVSLSRLRVSFTAVVWSCHATWEWAKWDKICWKFGKEVSSVHTVVRSALRVRMWDHSQEKYGYSTWTGWYGKKGPRMISKFINWGWGERKAPHRLPHSIITMTTTVCTNTAAVTNMRMKLIKWGTRHMITNQFGCQQKTRVSFSGWMCEKLSVAKSWTVFRRLTHSTM